MTACDDCLRRTWLIVALSAHFDQLGGRSEVQRELLALDDAALLAALTSAGGERARIRSGHARFDAAAARSRCRTAGVRAICRHDARYPRALLDLADAPAVLHLAGTLPPTVLGPDGDPWVAVVGARRASEYGLELAHALGRGLAAAGVTVVSGMALGVDARAHAGALEGGGRTVAVLAGAAEIPYPARKRALHGRIRESGAAISELPPGTRARRWCFPARNRIIAGIAGLTIVVEAGERSGALITARIARDLGRDVGAVPGRVTSRLAAGTNALIADGAHLVVDAQRALDIACGVGMRRIPDPAVAPHLDPRARRVLDAVADGRDTLAALAAGGVDPEIAMVAVAELELHGLLRREAGGRYVRVAAPLASTP